MTAPNSSSADARALQDALREEAFIWLGRLADGEVTHPELQAFKRWQGSSADHAAAFEDAKRQWKTLKPAALALLQADPAKAQRHSRLARGHGLRQGRRAFLGAGAAAAAVAGMAAVYPPLGLWPSLDEWSADYRTATGEQRTFAVGGEVEVTLNTQSTARRQAAARGGIDGVGGIELISGEAAVDLPDGGRPFMIAAGNGEAVSQAGRFEVRHLDGKVCVTCLAGTVRVRHAAGGRSLLANQQTVYTAASIGGIASVNPQDAAAWRKGELVFNRTPLAQVVEEINRYRPGRIVLLASAGPERPVVGRFPITILDEALLQIQHAFGLRARRLPAGVLVLG